MLALEKDSSDGAKIYFRIKILRLADQLDWSIKEREKLSLGMRRVCKNGI